MNLEFAWADVIGQGKIAAPFGRNHSAAEGGEKRLRVAVGNRKDGNLGDDRGLFDLQALGACFRSDTRGEWITWKDGIVGDAASLDALARTISALRKSFALKVAVPVRIGIDEAAESTVLGGDFGLDAAPGVPVASDGDGSFYGNAEALEAFVVFRDSIVHVNQRRGDIAVFRKSIVGRQLLGLLAGSGIDGECGLL